MTDRIEVGDLVIIVRGHECQSAHWRGLIFTVTNIVRPERGEWYCPRCGTYSLYHSENAATGLAQDSYIPLSWLKRIPPLSKLESIKECEKVTV